MLQTVGMLIWGNMNIQTKGNSKMEVHVSDFLSLVVGVQGSALVWEHGGGRGYRSAPADQPSESIGQSRKSTMGLAGSLQQ